MINHEKKKSSKISKLQITLYTATLIVGLLIGYFSPLLSQPHIASATEIEAAKNAIAKLYQKSAVSACWRVNQGENLAYGKYELNYRNIRINQYANRAIITDCADNDMLLAKNKSGTWHATNVNIVLANRVNPTWQKACEIQNISVADDTIRPENSSIDNFNLAACNQLRNE